MILERCKESYVTIKRVYPWSAYYGPKNVEALMVLKLEFYNDVPPAYLLEYNCILVEVFLEDDGVTFFFIITIVII
jgi:hypothetical protein